MLAIPWFYQNSADQVEAELRTHRKESTAFHLGQAKVIYTQLQDTLQYRLQTKPDPDWVNNPKIQELKVRMGDMLTQNRQWYCLLDDRPCNITDDATWPEIYAKLDNMLRRQYIGRIENAYHVGELVSIFHIETTVNPAEHDLNSPVLHVFLHDTTTIWVGHVILLPDNASLRHSILELYDYAKRNRSPPAHDFERLARPILSYYLNDA